MLKIPPLPPDSLHVRVFEGKIGARGLLRRWALLTGGPRGHASRSCSAATSSGPLEVFSISRDLESKKYLYSLC